MSNKKSDTKFTIQFNRNNPLHLQAVEALNRQNQRGKARYIVDAILHYENCSKTPNTNPAAQLDEKSIEAVVNRILKDKQDGSRGNSVYSIPAPDNQEEENFDIEIDSLGKNGFNAIANAMAMFRKK